MQLISLNCWGGKLCGPLIKFIEEQAGKTDIFCFQEMVFGGPDRSFSHHKLCGQLFERIAETLKGHRSYRMFAPKFIFGLDGYNLEGGAKIGQVIFVKRPIAVSDTGFFRVYPRDKNPFKNMITGHITGNCQYIDIMIGDKPITIINIHGFWQYAKSDTPERIEQSRKILEFIKLKNQPAIIVGDFNLRLDTESIKILGNKLRNLVFEYKIATTRNRFYRDMEKYKDYIADYAFVSKEIKVKNFKVLKNEVSDHLPLFLEFDLK